MREAFGFDRPLVERYVKFLRQVVKLDFGRSIQTRMPAAKQVLMRFPATLLLAFSSLLLATLIGCPLRASSPPSGAARRWTASPFQ